MMRRILIMLLVTLFVGAGASAQAFDWKNPFDMPDCKYPAVVSSPGYSIAGEIDPRTETTGAGTKYLESGYSGYVYHTYDWGCIPRPAGAMAEMDTAVGNTGLQVATVMAAISARAHKIAVNPSPVLQPLDDAVGVITRTIKKALYTPWAAVIIVLVAATIIGLSAAGRLSDAIAHAMWLLAALAITVGMMNLPSTGLDVFDETVAAVVDDVEGAAAGVVGGEFTGGLGDGHSSLVVEQAIYKAWLRGTLGTIDPDVDEQWGTPLWEAQRLTYDEAAKIRAGDKGIVEAKNAAWKDTMSKMEEASPELYAAARGARGARGAAGWWAVLDVLWMTLFSAIADIFRAFCLVIMRCIIPVVAAVGVLFLSKASQPMAIKTMTVFLSCLVNSALMGVMATIHIVLIGSVFTYAPDPVSLMLKQITCALITVVMLVLAWPLFDLRKIAGVGASRPGMGLLRRLTSLAGTALAARAGVHAGLDDKDKPDVDEPRPEPRPEVWPVPETAPGTPALPPGSRALPPTHQPAEARTDGTYAAPPPAPKFGPSPSESPVRHAEEPLTRHHVYTPGKRSEPIVETPHASGKVKIWDPRTNSTIEVDV